MYEKIKIEYITHYCYYCYYCYYNTIQYNMALTFIEFLNKTGFTPKTKFCKLLNGKLNHFGFQYKLGLNEDHIEFNPTKSCEAGGLYFTTDRYLYKYLNFGINIATIELCEDALYYIDQDDMCMNFKFKTNKFKITNIYQTEEMCKSVVRCNDDILQYVEQQTEEICKLAVQRCGFALQYVKEQTEEICKLAVQQNGFALRYVKIQTKEICKLAVKQIGLASYFVRI